MCGCSRRRLITIASGLQLNLGLGLFLLGIGGATRVPTAVLWPTLAAVVCGLLSVALSYCMLVASNDDKILFVLGYTGWSFALLFAALATECLMQVAQHGPSMQDLCDTFAVAPCIDAGQDAMVEGVEGFYAHCGLAARCALAMSVLMLSRAIVQHWVNDTESIDQAHNIVSSGSTCSRLIGGLLVLLTSAGGAAMAGVAEMMAPKQIHVTSWHPAVVVSVFGVGLLGVVSALVGALACRHTIEQLRTDGLLPDATARVLRAQCSLNTDVPLQLGVAWICLSSVLFSWSFAEDAQSNFEQRWDSYASAWPELTDRYCTERADAFGSEYMDASSLDGGLYDQQCVLAGFREAQSLYRLAASLIAGAFFVQFLIVRMLRRALYTDCTSIMQNYFDDSPMQTLRRAVSVERSSTDSHLDDRPV